MFLTKATKIENNNLIADYGFIETSIVLNVSVLKYLIIAIKKKGFKGFLKEFFDDRDLVSEALIEDGIAVLTKELSKKALALGANTITCLETRISVINNPDGSKLIVTATGVAQQYEED